MMTEAEARLEALNLAFRAIQDSADAGSVQDFYGDLPEDDQEKISQELKKIIEQLKTAAEEKDV